jgi:hypothetical protein
MTPRSVLTTGDSLCVFRHSFSSAHARGTAIATMLRNLTAPSTRIQVRAPMTLPELAVRDEVEPGRALEQRNEVEAGCPQFHSIVS